MIPIITLLVVLFLSLLITRIATLALMHTGMSKQVARFQARSALSTCGFSTSETEQIMNHPARRKIIMLLMLLGNVGVITVLSSLILTFIHMNADSIPSYIKVAVLLGGLVLLWGVSANKWLERHLAILIDYFLDRYTDLKTCSISHLLHHYDDHKIVEFTLKPDSAIVGQLFRKNSISSHDVLVLGVRRSDGTYVGFPDDDFVFMADDQVTVYGMNKNVEQVAIL